MVTNALLHTSWLTLLAATPAPPTDQALLCKDLPGCVIHERWPAGSAADNRRLQVVETRREAKNADGIECIEGAREFWLVGEGSGAPPPRRILRLCNDGYGIAGMGEDTVAVEGGKLLHTRYGGSNWRNHVETTIGLSPPVVERVVNDGTISMARGCRRTDDDPVAARRLSWLSPVTLDEQDERDDSDCEFSRQADSLDIPQLASGFLEESRKPELDRQFQEWTTGQYTLGNCALEFGSERLPAAHVLNGKTGSPVTVRALALDEVHWIIGVQAPQRTPQAVRGKWIHEDRLELWIGSFLFTWPDDIEAPQQFGVTLADGKVYPGSGAKGELPVIKHWKTKGWNWYAIDFSPVHPDWGVFSATVVYGEGDGRSQGLMLANSALKFSQPGTLGGLWTDYSHDCAIRDGVLVRTGLKPEFADPDHHDPLADMP